MPWPKGKPRGTVVGVGMKIIPKKVMRLGRCKNQTTLLRKYEKMIKPIILNRDENKCMISSYRHDCENPLVVDHRPSKRKNHSTFLDPRNLTTVCYKANYLAELDPFISHAIVNVVIAREGDIIEELSILSKQSKKWSQEECINWVIKCGKHFEKNKNGKPD